MSAPDARPVYSVNEEQMAAQSPERPLRNSVKATYDSRETGPRFYVTTEIGDRTIAFREPIADPFVRTTVTVGREDLLRALEEGGELKVTVNVGADTEMVNDVLELDDNTLVKGRTREAAFRSHLNEAIGRAGGDQ